MHQIGQTGKVTLEGKTFEVEEKPHHYGKTRAECEQDCPEEWQIPPFELLKSMRDDLKIRDQFGLFRVFEYIQEPKRCAISDGYIMISSLIPRDGSQVIGVRYAREISKK